MGERAGSQFVAGLPLSDKPYRIAVITGAAIGFHPDHPPMMIDSGGLTPIKPRLPSPALDMEKPDGIPHSRSDRPYS